MDSYNESVCKYNLPIITIIKDIIKIEEKWRGKRPEKKRRKNMKRNDEDELKKTMERRRRRNRMRWRRRKRKMRS